MRQILNGILIGTIFGFAIASGLFLYWGKEDMTAVKAEAIREATYAIRQHIMDQTNTRIDILDLDSMSDDELLIFTGKRSDEYRKRFIDPNFKRDP